MGSGLFRLHLSWAQAEGATAARGELLCGQSQELEDKPTHTSTLKALIHVIPAHASTANDSHMAEPNTAGQDVPSAHGDQHHSGLSQGRGPGTALSTFSFLIRETGNPASGAGVPSACSWGGQREPGFREGLRGIERGLGVRKTGSGAMQGPSTREHSRFEAAAGARSPLIPPSWRGVSCTQGRELSCGFELTEQLQPLHRFGAYAALLWGPPDGA